MMNENKTPYYDFYRSSRLDALKAVLPFDWAELSREAQCFFHTISNNDSIPKSILDFLTALNIKHISLKSYHVNQAIQILHFKEALPDDCFLKLDAYLASSDCPFSVDVIERFQQFRMDHCPELLVQAAEHGLLHHSLPHALEIEKRTMRGLKALNIWQEETKSHVFLRHLACVIALFHDYVQKNEKNEASQFSSNEEATAFFVFQWILEVLKIDIEQEVIKPLIQLMVYEIIVGGTTFIMSAFSTGEAPQSIDLLDLQNCFSQAKPIGSVTLSNQLLIADIYRVAELVGAYDKTPGACLVSVIEQVRYQQLASDPVFSHLLTQTMVLDRYFRTSFQIYYPDEKLALYYTNEDKESIGDLRAFGISVNRQAFFVNFVPHFSMPPEFCKHDDVNQKNLYAFIKQCRENYHNYFRDITGYQRLFDESFERYEILLVVEQLFFNDRTLKNEIAFIDSQIHLLKQKCTESSTYDLFDASIPETDKCNLRSLHAYYHALCDHTEKKNLIKALLWHVVLQEGQMLAYSFEDTCHVKHELTPFCY